MLLGGGHCYEGPFAIRLEAIAIRVEAIALRLEMVGVRPGVQWCGDFRILPALPCRGDFESHPLRGSWAWPHTNDEGPRHGTPDV